MGLAGVLYSWLNLYCYIETACVSAFCWILHLLSTFFCIIANVHRTLEVLPIILDEEDFPFINTSIVHMIKVTFLKLYASFHSKHYNTHVRGVPSYMCV